MFVGWTGSCSNHRSRTRRVPRLASPIGLRDLRYGGGSWCQRINVECRLVLIHWGGAAWRVEGHVHLVLDVILRVLRRRHQDLDRRRLVALAEQLVGPRKLLSALRNVGSDAAELVAFLVAWRNGAGWVVRGRVDHCDATPTPADHTPCSVPVHSLRAEGRVDCHLCRLSLVLGSLAPERTGSREPMAGDKQLKRRGRRVRRLGSCGLSGAESSIRMWTKGKKKPRRTFHQRGASIRAISTKGGFSKGFSQKICISFYIS